MTKRASSRNLLVVQGAEGAIGPQGPGGDQGENGGLYKFEVIGGDLIVYFEDGVEPPPFTINPDGYLIYTF